MITGTEEIQLLERALKGDQAAYKILYDSHVDALFAFLNRFGDNREQVKDWTQRAFIKAFRKLSTFKQDARFKSWLFTIGMNEMRTDMRSRIRFVELKDELCDVTEDDNTVPDMWHTAKNAIQDLSPEKRIVVLLHIAEGYSHREIAEMLSIKEGHSRIILHRAKEELRKRVNS